MVACEQLLMCQGQDIPVYILLIEFAVSETCLVVSKGRLFCKKLNIYLIGYGTPQIDISKSISFDNNPNSIPFFSGFNLPLFQ